MRQVGVTAVWLACALLGSTGRAPAESRTFIVASAPDAYVIDQCLATGHRCGASAADAYCETKSFAKSQSFRRIEAAELTASVGLAEPPGPSDTLVAIECTR